MVTATLVDNNYGLQDKQSGFSCFYLDKRPEMSAAARYRSLLENPETQYCYLNANNSDKLFNTFVSKRTDKKDYKFFYS